MKIVDIVATPPLGLQNRNWVLLKVTTDEGMVGLGEWRANASIAGLKKLLVGRDPLNINTLHYDHLWRMQGTGAGVEFALWDIKGKALGVPLHELLGGKIRDRVRMYCDCHAGAFWTAEDYAERWREVRESGTLDPVYEPDAYVAQAKRMVAEGSEVRSGKPVLLTNCATGEGIEAVVDRLLHDVLFDQ